MFDHPQGPNLAFDCLRQTVAGADRGRRAPGYWLEAHLFDCLVRVLMIFQLSVWLRLYSRGKGAETQRGGWPALAGLASGPSFALLRLLKRGSRIDNLWAVGI